MRGHWTNLALFALIVVGLIWVIASTEEPLVDRDAPVGDEYGAAMAERYRR